MESNYIRVLEGDLLEAKEKYIVHQCNCVSTNACTLAKQIFTKYPFSNSYKLRKKGDKSTYSKPGKIDVLKDTNNEKSVVNFYSQFYPRKPVYPNDSYQKRIVWFKECLNKLIGIPDIFEQEYIAFPYNIGCGAAGGNGMTILKF